MTNKNMHYNSKTDQELISISSENIEALECLLKRYKKVVLLLANNYYMQGHDKEDLIQEGMISLVSAIKSFDSKYNVSFRTFASHCIRRGILSAVSKSNRQKHSALNNSITMDPLYNKNITKSIEIDDKSSNDPINKVIEEEAYYDLLDMIDDLLSKREKEVLQYFYKGYTYNEISELLNIKLKSVDTALSRARKKIRDSIIKVSFD